MDGSSGGGGGMGHRRNVHRGSGHRTSFIEYVSEVYNSSRGNREASSTGVGVPTTNSGLPTQSSGLGGGGGGLGGMSGGGVGSNMMEALSVRGHSISSGSVASGGSGALARDLSVRSEVVPTSNRVLGGRHHTTRHNKTSRVIGECNYLSFLFPYFCILNCIQTKTRISPSSLIPI